LPKRSDLAARAVFLSSALAITATTGIAASIASSTSSQDNGAEPIQDAGTQPSPGMTAGKVVDIAKAEQMVVVTTIPRGYRDWKFVPAAHEAGELNDIRVVVANDKAISAYRAAKPFPEGSVIGRVAWKMVPSEENNKTFAQPQSFVPGEAPDWYLQFMEKDSRKYAATGGWGYSNFGKDLKPTTDKKTMYACFTCHQAVQARDYVFTKYSP